MSGARLRVVVIILQYPSDERSGTRRGCLPRVQVCSSLCPFRLLCLLTESCELDRASKVGRFNGRASVQVPSALSTKTGTNLTFLSLYMVLIGYSHAGSLIEWLGHRQVTSVAKTGGVHRLIPLCIQPQAALRTLSLSLLVHQSLPYRCARRPPRPPNCQACSRQLGLVRSVRVSGYSRCLHLDRRPPVCDAMGLAPVLVLRRPLRSHSFRPTSHSLECPLRQLQHCSAYGRIQCIP
jgi:hypothetical protein